MKPPHRCKSCPIPKVAGTRNSTKLVVTASPKTIVVAIQTRYRHPKYGKILIKTKRYMAHDEANACNSGDIVLLEESAPYSPVGAIEHLISASQNPLGNCLQGHVGHTILIRTVSKSQAPQSPYTI